MLITKTIYAILSIRLYKYNDLEYTIQHYMCIHTYMYIYIYMLHDI